MKTKTQITFNEIINNFKWYRKLRGGTWFLAHCSPDISNGDLNHYRWTHASQYFYNLGNHFLYSPPHEKTPSTVLEDRYYIKKECYDNGAIRTKIYDMPYRKSTLL